jgi:hypothetical protein
MSSGNWLNNDGLYLQFGTSKTTPETAGEYVSYGANRVVEVLIDLTTLTTSATIQSNTTIFPDGANIFIEKVELVAETGCATGTSLSVGLIQMDRATIPSGYSASLVSAYDAATNLANAGEAVTFFQNTSGAGSLVGSFPASATGPYYITALHATTAYTTGKVKVRVYYHGVGTITQ